MSHVQQIPIVTVGCFVCDWFPVAAKKREEEEEKARKEKAEKGDGSNLQETHLQLWCEKNEALYLSFWGVWWKSGSESPKQKLETVERCTNSFVPVLFDSKVVWENYSWLMNRWCQLAALNVPEKIRRVKRHVTELWEPAWRSLLQTLNNILSNFTLNGKTNVSGRVNLSEWSYKHMWKCFARWLSSGDTGLWENTPWPMLFSHYTLKLKGWGSSGRRRKRRDWSSCWCPLDQKVRELLVQQCQTVYTFESINSKGEY